MKINFFRILLISIFCFITTDSSYSQVEGTEKRYVRIGSLQSNFSAYGSERAWNNTYYEGLKWPADYPFTDNAVIKRAWIGIDDFTDENGTNWEKYGIYITSDYVDNALFPMELKQTAKFEQPTVIVDGNNISSRYSEDVDEIDPSQIADRIVTNIVNTSAGLTMIRRVYVFSQQYHDNYFIKEFTFTNTGNIDYDDEIELNAPLKGVLISWGTRYSVSREGANSVGNPQVWGKYSWISKRGENYSDHIGESITEDNPIVDWIRSGYSWAGQAATNDFDNIGGPDIRGDGRLLAPQFAGTAILHVDKSAVDMSDNPDQPLVLGWHAGDTYPKLGDMYDVAPMIQQYNMQSGNPYQGLGGTNRFYEDNVTSITDRVDPQTIHGDGGGTNVWISYGPFDLEPGESFTFFEAEGINGLSREVCELIGRRWKQAYDDPNDKGPFELPDNSTTDDKDIYKNSWFYTGQDSIMLTFGRAKRNFDLGFEIPQPPLPPPLFEVESGGDRISLKWAASPSEEESNFAGYKIYRAVAKPDTVSNEIFSTGVGTYSFDDITAVRGFSYYYYIVAVSDGSKNTSGEANPTGPLYSSKYYTRTTEPAFLRRQAGSALDDIRVVPNPYNIRMRDLQYVGEPDKIMFLDIPGNCEIKIYTERGDLVNTIIHDDGSGDQAWNSLTSSRQVVVSGVYIALFKVTKDYNDPNTGELLYKSGDTATRKFIIIR